MKIVRTEQIRITREYTLEVTPQLLDEITESLKEDASNPDNLPTITEDHIKDAMDYNDTDEKNIEIVFNGYENSTYIVDLFDALRDCLDDYIWETNCKDLDYKTEDYNDRIVY